MYKSFFILLLIFIVTSVGRSQDQIFVANLGSHSVSYYDGETGAYLGDFITSGKGDLKNPTGITFGPDGNLYVSSSGNGKILKFDGENGDFLGIFASGDTLGRPFSIIFGPDNNLYASSGSKNVVLVFDGDSGEFIRAAANSPNLKQPIGIRFGSDDYLYVSNSGGKNVLKFDPMTGKLLAIVVSDSLSFNSDILFDDQDNLYVTNAGKSNIGKFNIPEGDHLKTFNLPEKGAPVGLAKGPSGMIYVGDFAGNKLYRLNPTDGTFKLLSGEGMARPENIAVRPEK